MNKYTYTVYLPTEVSRDRKQTYVASSKLSDFTSRLDRSDRKLTDLDETCLGNLTKCKLYYTSAQNRESRLKETLRETKKLIKNSKDLNNFSSKRTASIRFSSRVNYHNNIGTNHKRHTSADHEYDSYKKDQKY